MRTTHTAHLLIRSIALSACVTPADAPSPQRGRALGRKQAAPHEATSSTQRNRVIRDLQITTHATVPERMYFVGIDGRGVRKRLWTERTPEGDQLVGEAVGMQGSPRRFAVYFYSDRDIDYGGKAYSYAYMLELDGRQYEIATGRRIN